MAIPAGLRRRVVDRAAGRCEYCLLAQFGQEAEFHVDHIEPQAAGGPTVFENLALACVSCSLRKAARRTALDPATKKEVPIFHPRKDRWSAHFRWHGALIVGISSSGRATVDALAFNRAVAYAIRAQLLL
ncbi:MAG TPA: HNH endonuclease signature motif containing protein [Chthoniobacteraceae bacterium]|jgi:5-methylcytosine-specific restriction endonuclease McrA|nr:HNH endonuclease signature motif containing protein [Chthoniobacteraceae bacterium]